MASDRVKHLASAERTGQSATSRDRMDGDHPVRAREPGPLDRDEADRTSAEDGDMVAERDLRIAHGERHDGTVERDRHLAGETVGHQIGMRLVDGVRLANGEMTEEAVADRETGDRATDLRDGADRHVAQGTGERGKPLGSGPRDDRPQGGIIGTVGSRLVAVADELRPVLGRGEVGLDTDVADPKRGFVELAQAGVRGATAISLYGTAIHLLSGQNLRRGGV
jgi:hypothetical protein